MRSRDLAPTLIALALAIPSLHAAGHPGTTMPPGRPDVVTSRAPEAVPYAHGRSKVGWPVYTGWAGMSSPVVVDLDPAYPGSETLLLHPVYANGWQIDLKAWHADGTPVPGWAPLRILRSGHPMSVPAVADIDRDGAIDVVVALDNRVYAFDRTGAVKAGWPATTTGRYPTSSPVLADLDRDGRMEVLVTTIDGKLFIFRSNGSRFPKAGSLAWPKSFGQELYYPPAVANLDDDPALEIVVGGPGVSAWNIDGTPLFAPVSLPSGYWGATPAVGDLDGDGAPDIAIGAGYHIDVPGLVYALRADGTPLPGSWPKSVTGYPMYLSLADVDPARGGLEIAVAPTQGWSTEHHVLDASGANLPGWPIVESPYAYWGNAPVIGDMDGDGRMELATTTGQDSGNDRLHVRHHDGTALPGFPLSLPGGAQVSAALADIDGDGIVEIIQPALDGWVYAVEVGQAGPAPWPMHQGGAAHRGTGTTAGPR